MLIQVPKSQDYLNKQLTNLTKDTLRNIKKTPHIIDGKFCSRCNNEVTVEMDEGFNKNEFEIVYSPYCETCQRKVFVK